MRFGLAISAAVLGSVAATDVFGSSGIDRLRSKAFPSHRANAEAPSPNAKCFRSDVWFEEDCADKRFCIERPEFTTEKACEGDTSKLHFFGDSKRECLEYVMAKGWCTIPPPDPQCFRTDGWFFEECDSPKHCNPFPEFKSEESCKGNGSKLHYFAVNEEECRANVIRDRWCTPKGGSVPVFTTKAPTTSTTPTTTTTEASTTTTDTPSPNAKCFQSDVWFEENCDDERFCLERFDLKSKASCESDASKLSHFVDSKEDCLQSIIDNKWCTPKAGGPSPVPPQMKPKGSARHALHDKSKHYRARPAGYRGFDETAEDMKEMKAMLAQEVGEKVHEKLGGEFRAMEEDGTCFISHVWFDANCMSRQHCVEHPEYKTKQDCLGGANGPAYFVRNSNECRGLIFEDAWCMGYW